MAQETDRLEGDWRLLAQVADERGAGEALRRLHAQHRALQARVLDAEVDDLDLACSIGARVTVAEPARRGG